MMTIMVCGKLKSVYFDYKSRANTEVPQNPWRIQNTALFPRLDSFLERCHDLLDLCKTVVQFQKLERIEIGGNTTYTDVNGTFVVLGGGSQTVTSSVSGRYFVVNDEFDSAVSTETQTLDPGVPYNFDHNSANASEYDRAEVNAYVWANVTRDWALSHFPNMPTIATQTEMPVNINLSSMTINSFR